MAHQVKNLHLALENMSGFDARNPRRIPAPLYRPRQTTSLRVSVTFDPGGMGVSPQTVADLKMTADWFSNAGYEVNEVDPPRVIDAWETWIELTSVEIMHHILPGIKEIASPKALQFLHFWSELFPGGDLISYMTALSRRNAIAR
jgi:amidase